MTAFPHLDETHTRALGSLLHDIAATAFRTAGELVPNECQVRVHHDWYGFGGLDSRGRMILWAQGHRDPFLYGPTTGETFPWRDLIGGGE